MLDSLSKLQKDAVTFTNGPLLVFAGAGSGKTRVITYRISYLLNNKDVLPENILAVTFTNKAAKEMKERISSLVKNPSLTDGLTISTFHSLGLKILKNEYHKIGYNRHFVVFSQYEQTELLKKVMKEENISTERFSPKTILTAISKIKNDPGIALSPSFLVENINFPIAKRVLEPYTKAMQLSGAMDFDDLIVKTVTLLKTDKSVLEKYSKRYRYIMVDEYQDTNNAQFELVRMLSSYHNNIFVVGDDDQSIYSWRGAKIENILNFQKIFNNCGIVKLEENYRSVSEIVDAAGNLIACNNSRVSKRSFTSIKTNEDEGIKVINKNDENSEAEFTAAEIIKMSGFIKSYSDIAVIIRANYQSKPFEVSFQRHGIPYVLIGGQKFYENKEIKDILAYLKIIINPFDEISLRRIINYPPRKIGMSTQEKLFKLSEESSASPLSLIKSLEKNIGVFSSEQNSSLATFQKLYFDLSSFMNSMNPVNFSKKLIELIKIEDEIKKSSESETIARIKLDNVSSFIDSVATDPAIKYTDNTRSFFTSFVNSVALIQSGEEDNKNSSVNIITAHSAKGLEYDTVFIPGFYQGGMPNQLAIEEGSIEEERRLAYVAMTRAKKRLFITIPSTISHRGNIKNVKQSVFLKEAELTSEKYTGMPDDTLKMFDDMLKRIREN
jgi:DNA helicase II / ATP-dependent DNA helicase PcrA